MKATTRPPSYRLSWSAVIPSHATSCGRNAPAADWAMANAPAPASAAEPASNAARPNRARRFVLSMSIKYVRRGRCVKPGRCAPSTRWRIRLEREPRALARYEILARIVQVARGEPHPAAVVGRPIPLDHAPAREPRPLSRRREHVGDGRGDGDRRWVVELRDR